MAAKRGIGPAHRETLLSVWLAESGLWNFLMMA